MTTNSNNASGDHFNPSVRLLQITKNENDGSCGFHLSRSKWDPYPWVSTVDDTTPAEITGLKVGDCVLEVNGEDILGLRISEIANLVKAKSDTVTLLLWSTGNDPSCDPESLCCGPMPLSLERLSACMQTILSTLECPVCMDIIPPPVLQCQNGHILCIKCRSRSEKCPICRERYSIVRSLIAEQIYNTIITAFKLHDDIDLVTKIPLQQRKLREKLFGIKYKKKHNIYDEHLCKTIGNGNVQPCIQTQTNKFLAKILGKAYSLDSLSNNNDKNNIKDTKCLHNIENMSKGKHFSLSANDLSITENLVVAIQRCPSANRIQINGGIDMCNGNVISTSCSKSITKIDPTITTTTNAPIGSLTLNGLALNKRPSSLLNVSSECIGLAAGNLKNLQLVPKIKEDKLLQNVFICPYCCRTENKFEAITLQQHIKFDHNIPIILFGSSIIEISLPPKAPIENAALILTLDNKQIWIKLTIDKADDSIFIMALVEGTVDDSLKYMIEARLRNQAENKLLEKELITRSIVYSLMEISSSTTTWNITNTNTNNCRKNNDDDGSDINNSNTIKSENEKNFNGDSRQDGIYYNQNNIKAMFNNNSELLLKIYVKHRQND